MNWWLVYWLRDEEINSMLKIIRKQMVVKMNQDAQIELEKTLFKYWNQTTLYTKVSLKVSKHGNNS
jgi:hypothetical protein